MNQTGLIGQLWGEDAPMIGCLVMRFSHVSIADYENWLSAWVIPVLRSQNRVRDSSNSPPQPSGSSFNRVWANWQPLWDVAIGQNIDELR